MTPTPIAVGSVSAEALRNPRAALRVIDAHIRADYVTGRCTRCGELSPCRELDLAYAGLSGTSVLPRREPGSLLIRTTAFNAFGAMPIRPTAEHKTKPEGDDGW